MIVANPVEGLLQLSAGFYVSRALHAVANLAVADAIDDTPRPVAEVAAAVGADAGALQRVIRLLALYGIFEYRDGHASHTTMSRLMRQDHPQSIRPLVRMFGSPGLWKAAGELPWAIATGEASADRALPGGIWGYLSRDPEASRIFGEAMTAKAQSAISGIVDAYDFSRFNVIADIGGGRGHLLDAILAATPSASGILFDQPHVVSDVIPNRSSRMQVVGGDFFRDALPSANAYLLMEVIHDWDDASSQRILSAVRRAAPDRATLLLIELLLPDDAAPNWPTTLDLVMLSIGGRQRTLAEYRDLLAATGFEMLREIDTHAGIAIIEARAA